MDLRALSLIDLAEALRAGRIAPLELMEATLARIEATRSTLNAVVAVGDRESLLEAARTAADRIARGEARPLEGIPLGVKDLEDAAGFVTSQGSVPFRDRLAERDSTQVARLRAAGAIVVGKTNSPEFGSGAITKNLLFGPTRSPWNTDLTPGGSSGGSAAAIAGTVLPLVTASDGGGSIRIPSSFSGTFGLKTSYGRVPLGPMKYWPYSDTAVYGPLTKTVEDAALFLDQVAGPSPCDPNSLPHPGISYLETVRQPPAGKLRIGYSPDLGYAVVQSDVAAAVEDAVKVFARLGHRLEAVAGGPPIVSRDWELLGGFEWASQLHAMIPAHEKEFGRAFLEGVKLGWRMTPELWGEAAQRRAELNAWCAQVFSRFDVLVTPTVPYDPPPARGPIPTETEGRQQVAVSVAAFTIPFNLSWHPAATVRVGRSRAGLPIGMQIVGPRHRDDLVLQAARAFEQGRPWHPQWPAI